MSGDDSAGFGVIPRAAVSAAIFCGNSVLLVKRARPPAAGLWSLPGGHIEPGERAIDAMRRELLEETATDAKILGVAGVTDVVQQNDRGGVLFHKVIIVFYGLWCAGDALAGSDANAVQWQEMDTLEMLDLTEGLVEIVSNAKQSLLSHIR